MNGYSSGDPRGDERPLAAGTADFELGRLSGMCVARPPSMAVIHGPGVDGIVVFAGYGWQSEGTFFVPEGTMIRVPQPHDGRLLDHHGQLIERMGRIPVELLTEGYWPGMAVPNLWLGPPGSLHTLPTSTTVTSPTPLSELLRPQMGICLWAACRVERWGGDHREPSR